MAGTSAVLGCRNCIIHGHAQHLVVPPEQACLFPNPLKLKKNCCRYRVLSYSSRSVLDLTPDALTFSLDLQPYWREEALSDLRRFLLESQWAVQSTEWLLEGEHTEVGSGNFGAVDNVSAGCVVRSGKPSARQRRLSVRLKLGTYNRDARAASCFSVSETFELQSKRKAKVKVEPINDFVSSFLKPASGCGMFTKLEEKGFTRKMRIHQSLEKARKKLKEKLGYDPPHELLAQSVGISTLELVSMMADGEAARHMMLMSHLRLVVSVAKRYQNLGVDTADLIQEGSRGLLRGLDKFDHRKGHKISTYVHWWIRQGITRAIADHSRMMRVPAYLHETMFAMKRAKAQLIREGRPVTVEHLAQKSECHSLPDASVSRKLQDDPNLSSILKVSRCRIKRALQAEKRIISLDRKSSPFDLKKEFNGIHEFVGDKNAEGQPWDLLYEDDKRENIMRRFRLLTTKEQQIIGWLFGIDTKDGTWSSLESVGNKVGVSKERVRQIKFTALQKMRLVGGEVSL